MQIQDPILTTDYCRYCLMCRHVCPVGNVTRMETLTPHGWGLTIASVRRGLLRWNEESVGVVYKCADCGACRAHCVTDQPLPDAIAAARAEIAGSDLAPAPAQRVVQALAQWGNPFESKRPQASEGTSDTALFVGDDAPYLWPGVLTALQLLLKAVGVQPVLIGRGRNTGYLASSLGFPDLALSLARENMEELRASGSRRLLVLTPGDYFTFKQLYDERFGIDWPANVALQEVTTFLADEMDAGRLRFKQGSMNETYAYVDPSHSVRVKTRYDAPRKLLQAVWPSEPCELFWRCERTHPCGNTALQFTNPTISEQLTRARLEDAAARCPRWAVTEDPACLSHLERYASEYSLRVQGLYELLAEHLD